MIEQHMALSTGHISKKTGDWLDYALCDIDQMTNVSPLSGGPYAAAGWFMHCPEEVHVSVPEDLKLVMQFVRKNGCSYLLMDRDADTIEGLEVFEW